MSHSPDHEYPASTSPSHPHEQVRLWSERPSELSSRQKANERQRRKRERDRMALGLAPSPDNTSDANIYSQDQMLDSTVSDFSKRKGGGKGVNLDELPADEAAKRARIRNAARERQRKHRAGIKAKRMAQLGMAIVNAGGGVEQTAIGYTINENGQYEAVLADPNHPHIQHPPIDPPFPMPHPHATPGQTFASTLLLALSCTPRLKYDLLRTLHSSPEELAEFEHVIAAAFDHWEHSRSLHYAAQGDHATSSSYLQPQLHPDFRDRFPRPLGAAVFGSNPHHDADNSPSPSDESHRGDGESEAQVDHEPFCFGSGSRLEHAHIENGADLQDNKDEDEDEEQDSHTFGKAEDEDS